MSEKANNKKAKYTLAKVIVALCVVLCVVLTVFEVSPTYRVMKAVEVNGTEYSVAEYNWLYTNSVYEVYNNLYQSYGDLAAYFLNPQNPLDEQDYSDEEIMEIALIENIQRQDLNPIEEAMAYQRLIEEFELTQDEVAEKVSKSRPAVSNSLRLLKLTKKVQQMHSYRQAHQKADQHYPAVGVWPAGLLIPLCHRPEHEGGHK